MTRRHAHQTTMAAVAQTTAAASSVAPARGTSARAAS
jgi:hypothetical protein